MACYDDARWRADCDCGAAADDDGIDFVFDYTDDEYGWRKINYLKKRDEEIPTLFLLN